LKTINLRLTRGRICNPDLVILTPVNYAYDQLVLDVATVRLICEVVSPDRPAVDRVLKMHYYAEARIPWYLLVEQEPQLTLQLMRYEDGHYVEHAVGRPGAPLRLTEPVSLDLDPAVLLARR
jgi:Uma2 family endonuclease